ncbi:hypothetical protein L9F63_012391, partial [Diploptera punctata]
FRTEITFLLNHQGYGEDLNGRVGGLCFYPHFHVFSQLYFVFVFDPRLDPWDCEQCIRYTLKPIAFTQLQSSA